MLTDVRVHAPDFAANLKWLSAPAPLSLRALRGHVVLLDFWTYCCVNCMHVQPVLRRLEERFASEPFVVIGVHSAKFDEEKDERRIQEAMARYDVRHPVVVDVGMRTWHAFAVRSWPTLVLVRADGTIAAVAPGEPDEAALVRLVEDELETARRKGILAAAPLSYSHDPLDANAHRALAFPGKVAPGPSGLLAVSDSGHNRVLVLAPDGRVVDAVGSGMAGYRDGPFDDAAFDDPQGLAWITDDTLVVADARSHTLRAVDFRDRVVSTLAGTGRLGSAPLVVGRVEDDPTRVALRSPWDVAVRGNSIYIALAGSHQIAIYDRHEETLAALAGTGAESIFDGPFEHATFAQPSGLALSENGATLFVADSETSSVRALDRTSNTVTTLVGRGLFDFGYEDGSAESALFQHALGVAVAPSGIVAVADTYNHALRLLSTRAPVTVTTLARGLSEPGGVAWDAHRGAFVVADTNHHRLVAVSLDGSITPVDVRGAKAPRRGRLAVDADIELAGPTDYFSTEYVAEDDGFLSEGRGAIHVTVRPPAGRKFAAGSPATSALEVSRRSDLLLLEDTEGRHRVAEGGTLAFEVVVRVAEVPSETVAAEMVVRVDAVTCGEGESGEGAVCVPSRVYVRLPISLRRAKSQRVTLRFSGRDSS